MDAMPCELVGSVLGDRCGRRVSSFRSSAGRHSPITSYLTANVKKLNQYIFDNAQSSMSLNSIFGCHEMLIVVI